MDQGAQFVAGIPEKIRVEQAHFDCESDLVNNSLAGTVAAGEQFEVLNSVILSVAINVMDGFIGSQVAGKMFGHNVTMFKHGAFFPANQRRDRKPDISVLFDVTAILPRVKSGKRAIHLGSYFAFLAAIFLLAINAASSFALAVFFSAALLADKFIAFIGIFAAASVRTIHRAIQRAVPKTFTISSQKRLHHNKWFSAFFTGKTDRSFTQRGDTLLKPVGASASEATVFAPSLYVAGVAIKKLATVFTPRFDRHGISPLFDRKGEYAMLVRGSQALMNTGG
jgi:hypothetical protein